MPCSPYSPQMDRAPLLQSVARISSPHARQITSCLLSVLAVLLKARYRYKVNFRVGTDLDTTDGGGLCTPKGKRIALVFAGNLWRLPMWSSPSRYESPASIPAHQNPFAALLNIPENVACTRAASQPFEASPLELLVADQIRRCQDRDGHLSYNTHLRMYNPEKVAGILRTFRLSLLISNVKRVLLHLARAPIVQVNAYRTRAIAQSVSRNPRSF
jgi:hypothetical protein